MEPRRAALLFALSAAAFSAACGLDLAGTLATSGDVDGSAPRDASIDVTVPDAAGADGTIDAPSDASAPVDAYEEPEAAPPPQCNGLRCGTGCLVDASTCVSCDAGTLLCASSASCVSECAGCATGPIDCYACDTSRNNPVGSCQPNDASAFCLSGDYGSNHLHCSCNTAADCPSPNEVCIAHDPGNIFEMGNACYTCGEKDDSHDTNGDTCGSGGTCNTDAAVPSCQ